MDTLLSPHDDTGSELRGLGALSSGYLGFEFGAWGFGFGFWR